MGKKNKNRKRDPRFPRQRQLLKGKISLTLKKKDL